MHHGAIGHFSNVAGAYAVYRPTYPGALFDWLAAVAPGRDLAWDCGAGSGQATRDLVRRFRRVVATDASRAQLGVGVAGACTWAATAERSAIRSRRVDLVTAAQALHWFDLPVFYEEARRVLRRDGVVAAWTYADPTLDGAPGQVLARFAGAMRPWWPAQRELVDSGYRAIPFPFEEIPPPDLAMTAEWPLDAVVGYLGTWSAVGARRERHGIDPLPLVRAELADVWGDPAQPRRLAWTLAVRAGRV
jgi:SAM-dependent methyltransferase